MVAGNTPVISAILTAVSKQLECDQIALLGHSMGAGMASLFAATYPDLVQALVMIDCYKLDLVHRMDVVKRTRLAVETSLKLEDKLSRGTEKVYSTEAEVLTRILEAAG